MRRTKFGIVIKEHVPTGWLGQSVPSTVIAFTVDNMVVGSVLLPDTDVTEFTARLSDGKWDVQDNRTVRPSEEARP